MYEDRLALFGTLEKTGNGKILHWLARTFVEILMGGFQARIAWQDSLKGGKARTAAITAV